MFCAILMNISPGNPNVFVCTKPLQILVSMILSAEFNPAQLFVVESFSNSLEIAKSNELRKYFTQTKHFLTRADAIKAARHANPKSVFIDSDIGLKTQFALAHLKLRAPTCSIFVYEEGIGTYRTDIIKSKLKRAIYRATGTACRFGESVLTERIFVFSKEAYLKSNPHLKRKVRKIENPLSNFIRQYQTDLLNLFSPGFSLPEKENDDAYIYLSDWKLSPPAHPPIKCDIYIKPHPHISKEEIETRAKNSPDIHWLPGSIPAEIIIELLSKRYNHVIINHNNSSAAHYMKNLVNMIEIKT